MKMRIDEMSSREICERLNTAELRMEQPENDYLDRLYMEDGEHYEDRPGYILSLLEDEAVRRGIQRVDAARANGKTVWTMHGKANVIVGWFQREQRWLIWIDFGEWQQVVVQKLEGKVHKLWMEGENEV